MSRVDELFILIPVLNNMKGNLEMNLSSRLSTAVSHYHLIPFAVFTQSYARHILVHSIPDTPDNQ